MVLGFILTVLCTGNMKANLKRKRLKTQHLGSGDMTQWVKGGTCTTNPDDLHVFHRPCMVGDGLKLSSDHTYAMFSCPPPTRLETFLNDYLSKTEERVGT